MMILRCVQGEELFIGRVSVGKLSFDKMPMVVCIFNACRIQGAYDWQCHASYFYFNTFLTNGLVHHFHSDDSTFILIGIRSDF